MREIIRVRDDLDVYFKLNSVVMQATSLCNMNCTYCYLPGRNENNVMPSALALKIADDLGHLNLHEPIRIVWHSGEPLAAGVQALKDQEGSVSGTGVQQVLQIANALSKVVSLLFGLSLVQTPAKIGIEILKSDCRFGNQGLLFHEHVELKCSNKLKV